MEISQPGSGGGSITVTDGTTTVPAVTEIDFTQGAVVTDGGGGIADVAISAVPAPPDRSLQFDDAGALGGADVAYTEPSATERKLAIPDTTIGGDPGKDFILQASASGPVSQAASITWVPNEGFNWAFADADVSTISINGFGASKLDPCVVTAVHSYEPTNHGNQVVTSVSVAGNALTHVLSKQNGDYRVEIWVGTAFPVANGATLIVNWTGAVASIGVLGNLYDGVDQATPVEASVSDSATAGNSPLSVTLTTTTANDWIFDTGIFAGTETLTLGASPTQFGAAIPAPGFLTNGQSMAAWTNDNPLAPDTYTLSWSW